MDVLERRSVGQVLLGVIMDNAMIVTGEEVVIRSVGNWETHLNSRNLIKSAVVRFDVNSYIKVA